jgi:cell division protein ZapB
MPNAPQIDQLAERIERLLVRYEELQRTNALLGDQVESLSQERDSLKSRLGAARARVDALLERLPQANGNGHGNGNGNGSSKAAGPL